MFKRAFLFGVLSCMATVATAAPTHVVVVVLDQMRADYIDTYHLSHLAELRDHSLNFTNANVGHYPSITLMGHPALATGLSPKHFGWGDEIMHDTQGRIGPAGAWHNMGELTLDQYHKIYAANVPQPTALAQLKRALHGQLVVVGEKRYAAYTMGGMDADIVVTMGDKTKDGALKGWREPAGLNIPNYIAKPIGGRFFVDGRNDYGTGKEIYPIDGNRYVPGTDSTHLGGDVWAIDVALSIMQHDSKWRLLFITLGAIDKIGHVFGEMDNPKQQAIAKTMPYNLEKILHVADDQVGRLIAQLKADGLWETTLFIATADHGGVSAAKHFYGNGPVSRDSYGDIVEGSVTDPGKILAKWFQPNRVHHATFDTGVSLWLTDDARKDTTAQCKHFAKLPGAIAVYAKAKANDQWSYALCSIKTRDIVPNFLDPVTLLNTMATATSPDLVVQLADDTGYSRLGDHGGLQEKALRIPLIVHGPGITAGTSATPVRLADIVPLILDEMQLPVAKQLDGKSPLAAH